MFENNYHTGNAQLRFAIRTDRIIIGQMKRDSRILSEYLYSVDHRKASIHSGHLHYRACNCIDYLICRSLRILFNEDRLITNSFTRVKLLLDMSNSLG